MYSPSADDIGATLMVEMVPYAQTAAAADEEGSSDDSDDTLASKTTCGVDVAPPQRPQDCVWGRPVHATLPQEVQLDPEFEACLGRLCGRASAEFEVLLLPQGRGSDLPPGGTPRTLSLRRGELQLLHARKRELVRRARVELALSRSPRLCAPRGRAGRETDRSPPGRCGTTRCT